jgi:hypothetical protein
LNLVPTWHHAIVFYNYQGIDCKSRIARNCLYFTIDHQTTFSYIYILFNAPSYVYVANAPFKIFNEHYNDLIFTFLEISNTLMMFSYIYTRGMWKMHRARLDPRYLTKGKAIKMLRCFDRIPLPSQTLISSGWYRKSDNVK